MGIILADLGNRDHSWAPNYWTWRPIVEVIQLLNIVPKETAENLHEPYCGYGLSEAEARQVADAIEARVLPGIAVDQRMLLDGSATSARDDLVMHYEPSSTWRNYSTSRESLVEFVQFCRTCSGFTVQLGREGGPLRCQSGSQ